MITTDDINASLALLAKDSDAVTPAQREQLSVTLAVLASHWGKLDGASRNTIIQWLSQYKCTSFIYKNAIAKSFLYHVTQQPKYLEDWRHFAEVYQPPDIKAALSTFMTITNLTFVSKKQEVHRLLDRDFKKRMIKKIHQHMEPIFQHVAHREYVQPERCFAGRVAGFIHASR